MQRAFEVGKRLATWASRDWNKKGTGGVITCKDGTQAIMRNGSWVDANNPYVKLDLNYYPELTK